MPDLRAPDCGHDGRRSCNARNGNQNPEGLAEIQNAKEPGEEHTDQGQGADNNAQGAGDRVDDALQQVLDRREVDALRKGRDWQSSDWPEPATGSSGIECASGGSSQSITHRHDPAHVILGFSIGRDAAIACDRVRPRVVGSEREFGRAELRQHHQKVTGRAIQICLPIMRIYAELYGRCWHQLSEADRTCRTARSRAIGAFDLDIGLEEHLPFRHRQTCAAQSRVPAITMRGAFNGCEDFGAGNGAGGCRWRCLRLRR